MHNLEKQLYSAEVDFIVLDYSLNRPNIEEHILGYEDYVVIESANHKSPNNVYLDKNKEDRATEYFFTAQGKKDQKYKRLFMGDNYSIIKGVTEGLGRAVMPKHLLKKSIPIKILNNQGSSHLSDYFIVRTLPQIAAVCKAVFPTPSFA